MGEREVAEGAQFVAVDRQGPTAGTYNAVGPVLPFGDGIEFSRTSGGDRGPVLTADLAWLRANGVKEYMREESLPVRLAEQGWPGCSVRDGSAARAAGLRHRLRAERLVDTLHRERAEGLGQPHRAGLGAEQG
ncbi:hypothetical protein H7827_10585 [Streptomyces sp. JH002]|uniref:hypothetical protein n=1 Tax=Streptomyces sp. JH002 TaxID=2763259 RepID=UPI003D809413